MRRQRFATLWNDAKDVLHEEQQSGKWSKIAALLVVPVLYGRDCSYDPAAWESLVRQVAQDVSIILPWKTLFDAETDEAAALALLPKVEPDRLLLFTACLLLAQEAREAIRFSSPTPLLHYVLGLEESHQSELAEEDNSEAEDEEAEPVQTHEERNETTHDQPGPVMPLEDKDLKSEAAELETSLTAAS